MTQLVYSETLDRKIRKGSWGDLGFSTWDKVEEAIRSGEKERAIELLHYLNHVENKGVHDVLCDWVYALLTFIAREYGEEALYQSLRYSAEARMRVGQRQFNVASKVSMEENIQTKLEALRAHRAGPGESGNVTIRDRGDHYEIVQDPCGTGGRMMRKGELDGLPPRHEPPFNFGVTSKPYAWSWGMAGVSYYCVHCCVQIEILPIEWRGYPVRITKPPLKPEDPCVWLYYKKPESIPKEYFERIGQLERYYALHR
jgi:hypothetical protein